MSQVAAGARSGRNVHASSASASGFGQPGLAHLLDQHAPAGEQLRQPGDEGPQRGVQLVVVGRTHLDEARHAVGTSPVHAVQHQAVLADVEVGRRPEAPGRGDGGVPACVALEPGACTGLGAGDEAGRVPLHQITSR